MTRPATQKKPEVMIANPPAEPVETSPPLDTGVPKKDDKLVLGRRQFERGEYEQAIETFSEVIGSNPHLEHGYYHRAYVFNRIGLYERALNDLTIAINVKPELSNALSNRAYTFVKLGKAAEAIADCDKAIRYAAGNPDFKVGYAYVWRSRANYLRKDTWAAVTDSQKAKELLRPAEYKLATEGW